MLFAIKKEIPDGEEETVLFEQAASLHRRVWKSAVAANVVAWCLLPIVDVVSNLNCNTAIIWGIVLTATLIPHIILDSIYPSIGITSLRLWGYAHAATHLFKGFLWGISAHILVSEFDILPKAIIVSVVLTNCAGAVAALGAWLMVYLCFLWGACIPILFFGLTSGNSAIKLSCIAIAIFLGVMTYLGRDLSNSFRMLVVLRLKADRLARDLRREHEIAVKASKAKSSFLAAASHDLRQPVHALGLFIGVLQEAKMEKRAREIVQKIATTISGLDELFATLLDISQLDAGAIVAHEQPFHVETMMSRVYQDYIEFATQKNIRLIHVRSSITVYSDPILVERILRNLLSNALKYTSQGKVLIGCRRAGSNVRIIVMDTGVGIAMKDQAVIFDEFVQLDNLERDRSKGLGLGLSIVRRTAALLDSPLTFTSVLGRGSRFEFLLPATDRPVQSAAAVFSTAKGFIIVLGDEDIAREATVSLLSSWGHRVIAASSADEALAALAGDEPPDLILCEYRLRGGDKGLAVARQIENWFGERIRTILLTGNATLEPMGNADRSAGVEILHKPVAAGTLRTAVNSALLSPRRD